MVSNQVYKLATQDELRWIPNHDSRYAIHDICPRGVSVVTTCLQTLMRTSSAQHPYHLGVREAMHLEVELEVLEGQGRAKSLQPQ